MKALIERLKTWLKVRIATKFSLCVGVALVISILTLNLNLFRVEAYLYDIRMRLKGDQKPDSRIVLVALDEEMSIQDHLVALQNILKQKPASIAYLNQFDAADIDGNPAAAEKFAQTAMRAGAAGTNVFLGTEIDLSGEVLSPYPLSLLAHAPSLLHKDGTIFGEDKVVRRAVLTVFGEPSLHLRLAHPQLSRDALLEKAERVAGSYLFKPADSWHVLIRYPSNTNIEDEKSAFPLYDFSDLLEKESVPNLEGKIVLVDFLRREAINDFVFTPYSRITYKNPRLLVHASILNTLLQNDGISIASKKVDVFITVFLAFVLSYITIMFSPTRGVISLLILSSILFLFSLIVFSWAGIWLRLVHPLFAMFFTYYLIVPYRAILEYKKRWEVQQKHDLLIQVEEMKGNFLSLMSHDLKTPVARIQGLAEMVLRQGGLNDSQKSEMSQIVESTENLDKFISKILNLTKVESNEIQINRKSKDINKILEQCAKKLEFHAQSKNIDLQLRLDPLFPIQADAALLIQVFTNIIDNAIKYSPANSKIEVSSREVGDQVEVVVKDSGPGLDEAESQQLFTKFFRGKSHPGDSTKGSGLGLYLSKYFIEMHDGSIEAETKKGEGSKFIVKLPIQSNSVLESPKE